MAGEETNLERGKKVRKATVVHVEGRYIKRSAKVIVIPVSARFCDLTARIPTIQILTSKTPWIKKTAIARAWKLFLGSLVELGI